MFKFIHAADIHLDSPLQGLERYEGAPVERIRGATRQALKNLIELAISEAVALVLFAGDLYDGDWRDYNTGLFFAAEMSKLREAGIRVFIISGNHDAASQISRQLRMPDNVLRLSSRTPQTVRLDDLGVAIHGQGFSKPAITADLSPAYPAAVSGFFNIGMLHTSATGREGHEPYAPCTPAGLIAKGYDYWALGHVHRREVLCGKPLILFPGNLQGRHIKETGGKGCTLVTVDRGEIVSAEHRELDVIRWCARDLDVAGLETGAEIMDLVSAALRSELEANPARLLAVRLRIVGACKAHAEMVVQSERWINDIRMTATDIGSENIWLEKVLLQTEMAADLDEMLKRDDPIGGLLRSIQQLSAEDENLTRLIEEFSDLKRKLPAELLHGEGGIGLEHPDSRRELMEAVKQMLMGRLLTGGKGA
jgi:DNA repair protein SbcD/Mre11